MTRTELATLTAELDVMATILATAAGAPHSQAPAGVLMAADWLRGTSQALNKHAGALRGLCGDEAVTVDGVRKIPRREPAMSDEAYVVALMAEDSVLQAHGFVIEQSPEWIDALIVRRVPAEPAK